MHRHRLQASQDTTLHDHDREAGVLRLLFVSPDGKLLPATYRLCPACSVTMEEQDVDDKPRFFCSLRGLEIRP